MTGVDGADLDVLALGRPSVDLIFSGLAEWPGLGLDVWADALEVCAGTSFNTPASANRLGLRVGYVALVGTDMWSRIIRDEFERERLPTDFLRVVDRPSPFVSVALNHERDRGFVSYTAFSPGDDEEYRRLVRDAVSTASARHVHMYQGEFPELAAIAHGRGMTVSFDAWGGASWDGEGPLERALANADVLLANENEAIAMSGEPDVRRALARLAEVCPCVVVKRGVDGAIGSAGGQTIEVPAEPVEIVDATGAGDCFNGGFLFGWLGGRPLVESLTFGTICGERAAETFGGYRGCPTEAELRALARARGVDPA
jgi:sugar/nucleoside kinase (ribokinase family)